MVNLVYMGTLSVQRDNRPCRWNWKVDVLHKRQFRPIDKFTVFVVNLLYWWLSIYSLNLCINSSNIIRSRRDKKLSTCSGWKLWSKLKTAQKGPCVRWSDATQGSLFTVQPSKVAVSRGSISRIWRFLSYLTEILRTSSSNCMVCVVCAICIWFVHFGAVCSSWCIFYFAAPTICNISNDFVKNIPVARTQPVASQRTFLCRLVWHSSCWPWEEHRRAPVRGEQSWCGRALSWSYLPTSSHILGPAHLAV